MRGRSAAVALEPRTSHPLCCDSKKLKLSGRAGAELRGSASMHWCLAERRAHWFPLETAKKKRRAETERKRELDMADGIYSVYLVAVVGGIHM